MLHCITLRNKRNEHTKAVNLHLLLYHQTRVY